MKRTFTTLLLALVASGLLLAQQKQPQPKSQKEVEALQTLMNAATPDARIQAVDNLLSKFADTEFKPMALQFAAEAAREKGDTEKSIIYAERTLEADPKNYNAMLMIASAMVNRTKEFDLDKEEKLTRAEKSANTALELIPAAQKPNPAIPDDQWASAKMQFEADAYQTLSRAAGLRKKYDPVLGRLKSAAEASPNNYMLTALLSQTYMQAGKADDAVTAADKVISSPTADPGVKQFAQQVKDQATRAKGGTAAPKPATTTAPASAPAPAAAPKP